MMKTKQQNLLGSIKSRGGGVHTRAREDCVQVGEGKTYRLQSASSAATTNSRKDFILSSLCPLLLLLCCASSLSLHACEFLSIHVYFVLIPLLPPFCTPLVPAMITSHPNTTIAIKGQEKELTCTARGEWPIIIRWERGDTVIDTDRNPRYSITSSNEKSDEVISTLKVRQPRTWISPPIREVAKKADFASVSLSQRGYDM